MAMKSSRGSTDGHVVIQSSILLLQERFRQLQREKELREKRDLLKMFISSSHLQDQQHLHDPSTYHNRASITNNATTTTTTTTTPTTTHATMQYNCEPPSKQLLFFHPDLVFPALSKPSSQQQQQQQHHHQLVSLSLWPTSHTKQQQEAHDHQLLLTMDQTSLPSTLVSHASTSSYDNYHKFDDNSVSDVDTSLHL